MTTQHGELLRTLAVGKVDFILVGGGAAIAELEALLEERDC